MTFKSHNWVQSFFFFFFTLENEPPYEEARTDSKVLLRKSPNESDEEGTMEVDQRLKEFLW